MDPLVALFMSKESRQKYLHKHVSGNGFKTISKELDVSVTTVTHII